MTYPILWTFRRCPYAMRARLAIASAGIDVEYREILLRDKPLPFLKASPKGTVPVVQTATKVIEESLDVMLWALDQSDPEGWLDMPLYGFDLIAEADGPFKTALDRTKYASRHQDVDVDEERHKAGVFLHKLDRMLEGRLYLFSDAPCIADMAVLPFVRQFANVDLDWFNAQPWTHLTAWHDRFISSARFKLIMTKVALWTDGQTPILFPKEVS